MDYSTSFLLNEPRLCLGQFCDIIYIITVLSGCSDGKHAPVASNSLATLATAFSAQLELQFHLLMNNGFNVLRVLHVVISMFIILVIVLATCQWLSALCCSINLNLNLNNDNIYISREA